MRLRQALHDALLAEAARCLPLEACGLVGGDGEQPVHFIACRNARASSYGYAIAPEEVLAALKAFAAQGQSLSAIFHAHPRGAAMPSATDVGEAMYPGVLQLIAGFDGSPHLRGFWIEGGTVREEPLEIVP